MKSQDNSKGWPEGWLVAAAVAVLAAVMARVVGDLGLFAVLMIAVFVFLVFGVLLGLFWGGAAATPHSAQDGHGHAAGSHGGAASNAASHGVGTHGAEASRVGSHGSSAQGAHAAPVAASIAGAVHASSAASPAQTGIAEEAAARAIAVEDALPMPIAAQPVALAPEAVASDDGMANPPEAQALLTEPEAVQAVTEAAGSDPVTPAQNGAAEPMPHAAEPAEAPVIEAPDAVASDDGMAHPPVTHALLAEPAGPASAGVKPQGLTAARDGIPDRLQVIEGIGPVLEKLCHDLGIFHFDQIAAWGASEIAWMDSNLKGFKGRVSRDKWVRQAALIGEVGVDEFLRRAKTNDY